MVSLFKIWNSVTSHSNQNCAQSVQLSVAIKFSDDRNKKEVKRGQNKDFNSQIL
jgi:hypothetical protein